GLSFSDFPCYRGWDCYYRQSKISERQENDFTYRSIGWFESSVIWNRGFSKVYCGEGNTVQAGCSSGVGVHDSNVSYCRVIGMRYQACAFNSYISTILKF